MSTPDSRLALSKASPDTAEAGVPPLELRLSEGVPPQTTGEAAASQPRGEPSRTPTQCPPLLPDEVWVEVAARLLDVQALGRLSCTAKRFATPFSEAHRANASTPQLSVIEEGARLAVERIIDELADRSLERRASSRCGQEGGGVAICSVDGNQSASSWLRTLWHALRPLEFESRLCGRTVAIREAGTDHSCSILVQ